MRAVPPFPPTAVFLMRQGAIAAAYVVLAWIGLRIAFLHGTVSPAWPATGWAIAALTLWGTRMWPAVTAGSFLANWVFAHDPAAVALGIAVGNSLEALLGSSLLLRKDVRGEISRIRDALAILAVAVIAPAPSTVIGILSLGLGGFLQWAQVPYVSFVWWLGDSTGALLILPLVLSWLGTRASRVYVARPAELIGTAFLTVAVVTFAYWQSNVFLRTSGLPLVPISVLLIPTVYWAILRLRPREAVLILAIGCIEAVVFTAVRLADDIMGPLLGLQMMLLALGGGSLVMLGAITDRIKTQVELKNSREQLAYAMAAGKSGTFDWSLRSNDFGLSDELLSLYGLRREDCDGRLESWLACLVPEHREPSRAAIEQSLQTGQFSLEFQIRRGDTREIRWMAGRALVYSDAQGKPVRMMGIHFDITDLKTSEAKRSAVERRLQLAVDIAELGAWEFDTRSERLTLAPAWREKLGLPDGMELGNGSELWQERVHPEDCPRVHKDFQSYLKGSKEPYQNEYRFRFADGSYHWLSTRGVRITDEVSRSVKLIGAHLDITERKRNEQRIRDESRHDSLTRLPNRALILERGGDLLKLAHAEQDRCAVLFIDLDHFKPINDIHGHQAGDVVLKEVARRLRRCTRQNDLVGRLGGDEFIVVLPHTDTEHHRVDAVARHILEVVTRPIRFNALELFVSPSIGVSYFPEQGGDMADLIQKADVAMYQAKQQGRANFQAYTAEMERRTDEVLARRERFGTALLTTGLSLYYQPIMDLHDGRIIGVEALLRMVDERGKVVGPYVLAKAGEQSELGADFDEWVMTAACQQGKAWENEGLPPLLMSINLSPLQLSQRGYVENLRRIVENSGIDPSQLRLEVSCGAIATAKGAVDWLYQLKSVGAKVALDDFGTALCSLSRLGEFPLDLVKVGRPITRRLGTADFEAVPKAIIVLAHSLKFSVLGEGVETEKSLRALQQFGCDEAQGFFVSRPLAADDFAQWYRQRHLH